MPSSSRATRLWFEWFYPWRKLNKRIFRSRDHVVISLPFLLKAILNIIVFNFKINKYLYSLTLERNNPIKENYYLSKLVQVRVHVCDKIDIFLKFVLVHLTAPILEHTTLVRRHGNVKNWIVLELIHKFLIIKTGLSLKILFYLL